MAYALRRRAARAEIAYQEIVEAAINAGVNADAIGYQGQIIEAALADYAELLAHEARQREWVLRRPRGDLAPARG